MKPIKVLITGTTSSGKSTFLSRLREIKKPDWCTIPEIARQILELQPTLELEPSFQDILFEAQMLAEQTAISSGTKMVICDRGVVDNIAHARIFGQPIKSEWISWCQSYEQIFVCNHEDIKFNLSSLQIKLNNRDWVSFRENLHQEIISTLQDLGFEFQILGGTTPERLEKFERYLEPRLADLEGGLRLKGELK